MKDFDPVHTPLLTGINLLEASAGTGKTYTLAMLVLRFVVEQKVEIKHILVVTFTQAATEELKDRIRQRLAETRQVMLGNQSSHDDNLLQWLDRLDIEPDLILQRLNNALLDIDQAGIFTLHGFCQRILTEHALESGQLFDAELTGDIHAIKQACADDFWRQQIYLRSAREAALLTEHYQTPDQLLASVDHIASELTVYPDYVNLDHALQHLKQQVNSHKQTIVLSLDKLQQIFAEGKFKKSFTETFASDRKKITDWLTEKSIIPVNFSAYTSENLLNALNGQKFRTCKAKPESSDRQKQNYLNTLAIDTQPFEQLETAIHNITLVLRRSLLQTLHNKVNQTLEQLNLLSFDNIICSLANALKDEKGGILTQAVQQRYQVALIDEFQDTDPNQWHIFSTLFNQQQHALYLIGDPKQAIYQFRGADIYSYFAAQQQAQHHFTLGKNWRSQPHLVDAVNTLFKKERAFFSKQLTFNPVTAALSSAQGILTQDNNALPPLILGQLDKSEQKFWGSKKATDHIKRAVVNEILDLLNQHYYLQSKQSTPLQAKDIAILVRNNKQAKDFQLALNMKGVTAVINSKESVFSSQQANDLYILLQAIAQPANNTLLKQALTLKGFNLNGQQLFKTLNNEIKMDHWVSRFQGYQQDWQNRGLMAMMRHLLATEKFYVHLSQDNHAERALTNLQHCTERVQQAALDAHLGINKTLDWLHQNITQASTINALEEQQLRLESDEDAVNIITLHSAKGLEYPVVFCPFLWQRSGRLRKERLLIKCHINGKMRVDLGSEQFEQHRQIALDEELAEEIRLFYVAVTRAKYRCYLYWADVRSKAQVNQSAMAYLLDFNADDFAQQQQKLRTYAEKQPLAFEYRLLALNEQLTTGYQPVVDSITLSYQQKQRSLHSYWQMSSYTALSYLSIEDAPELPDDKAREEIRHVPLEIEDNELPRGVQTGNVIHDLLENISFKVLAEDNDIRVQRNKSCLRYGLITDVPEHIDHLLRQSVNTPLSQGHEPFSLKDLREQHCLKEMPFYLSMQTMDVSRINEILNDSPTYLPLSEKIMCGYLTGFIDLICEYQGQYYVMDYKSNYLENYDQTSLIQAMREHNYGLQYWIYSVVLHQYLQNRLPDYNYQQHFGGVKYLFVRGMDGKKVNSGVYQTRPEFAKIEKLVALFIGGAKN